MTLVAHLRILILGGIIVASPSPIHAKTAQRYDHLSAAEQRHYLDAAGCSEGGAVGDIERLSMYVRVLNDRYAEFNDFADVSDVELALLLELSEANNCLQYHTGLKEYVLAGCRIGHLLSEVLPPEQADTAFNACYEKQSDLTSSEVQQVKDWVTSGYERIIDNATKGGDPRTHYYEYMYGRYLCRAVIDCDRGAEQMYEAALSEYDSRGADAFDEGILRQLGELSNVAWSSQNAQVFRFVHELEAELANAGRLDWIPNPDDHRERALERVAKWSAKENEPPLPTKPLKELAKNAPPTTKPASRQDERPRAEERQHKADDQVVADSPEMSPEPVRQNRSSFIVIAILLLVGVAAAMWTIRRRQRAEQESASSEHADEQD